MQLIDHEFIFDQRHLESNINSNSLTEAQNLLKISYYKNLPRAVGRNKFERSKFSLEMFGDWRSDAR